MPRSQATGLTSRSLRPPHRLHVNCTSSERRGSWRSILTPPLPSLLAPAAASSPLLPPAAS